MILVLILNMLFASTFTLGKAALYYMAPLLFIGIRMTLGGLLLVGYEWWRKPFSLDRRSWILLIQIMFFHIYLVFVCEFWSLQYMSSAKNALIYNLSPFVTALFVFFLYKIRLTVQQWIGLCIGFAGLIPWIISRSGCEELGGSFGIASLPELVLLVAVVSGAYGWLVVDKLMKQFGYPPALINGIGMLGGGILAFLTSLIFEGRPTFLAPEHLCSPWLVGHVGFTGAAFIHVVIYLLALILIANVICYNLYAYLLTRHSATFLSFAGFTCSIFAGLFGWLFLGESLSVSFIITLLITSFGLFIFYQEELRLFKKK